MTADLTTGTAGKVWQPYLDAPLLTPPMVQGLAASDPGDARGLCRYLEAFVARRAAPVHVAVAFNAVYFGFDTETGGYVGGPLDIGEFPGVASGEQVAALPVGAMINVRTGGDLMPAEVVYKEGAHSALGRDGDLPEWLSGAPSAARGPGILAQVETPSLRERLVFDTTAFGRELSPGMERLIRLRRRGTLDEYGHLLVDARYAWPESELTDAAFYARYLVTRNRAQLTSSLVPLPLPLLLPPGSGPAALESALLGLLGTVREALASLAGVRMWGDYAFTRASMAARLGDRGPLGRDDLESLAQSVARSAVPHSRRTRDSRHQVRYTAVGPVLRASPDATRLLGGTAYPLAVCHANAMLTDYAARESNEATGRLASGVRLDLDDRWQGGGVWRAEYAEAGTGLDAGAPFPGESAGRGWQENLPAQRAPLGIPVESPTIPVAEPGSSAERAEPAGPTDHDASCWPDDSALGAAIRRSDADGRVEWAQPLRLRHLIERCLPLPEDVAAALALLCGPGDTVRVVVRHDGCELPLRDVCLCLRPGSGDQLTGVVWPSEFFAGMWLSFRWQRGERVLYVSSTLLLAPETIDGEPVEHRYDRHVVTRDATAGLRPADADRATGDTTDLTLVMTAVRRLGLLDMYGRAMLARTQVPVAVPLVMTDLVPRGIDVDQAVEELLAAGRLTTEHGSRGVDGQTYFPPRARERLVDLICYSPLVAQVRLPDPDPEDQPADSGRTVERHHVPGFLRRIGHLGHEASNEQQRLFREDFLLFGLTGTPNLPAGYTYVRPHHRGA